MLPMTDCPTLWSLRTLHCFEGRRDFLPPGRVAAAWQYILACVSGLMDAGLRRQVLEATAGPVYAGIRELPR